MTTTHNVLRVNVSTLTVTGKRHSPLFAWQLIDVLELHYYISYESTQAHINMTQV